MSGADYPPADVAGSAGIEDITDTENIFRRIPSSMGWVDVQTLRVKPDAFDPHKDNDRTGLSVVRTDYRSAEDAARGRSKSGYYIAVLNVGRIRAAGLRVVHQPHTPQGYDRAHAEIPDLTSANRKSEAADDYRNKLAELVNADPTANVLGPFHTSHTA